MKHFYLTLLSCALFALPMQQLSAEDTNTTGPEREQITANQTTKTQVINTLETKTSAAPTTEAKDEKVKLLISGFVTAEAIYDSRQTVSTRDGDVLLYPANEKLDENGDDIHASPEFRFLSVHSRLRVKTTPLSLWNGSLTALIEADFVGSADDKIGLLRLRHAMMNYVKGKSSIIIGEYWHPLFVTACAPSVSAWGAAVPEAVLSRNPQMGYSYAFTPKVSLTGTALTQLDFKSNGPNGASTSYLRNAAMPEFDLHLAVKPSDNLIFGALVGTKALRPMLVTANNYKTTETIRTYQASVYLKYTQPSYNVKMQALYLQDGYILITLGGYAASEVDPVTMEYSYTPISSLLAWGELSTTLEKQVNYGFYVGYTKHLGAEDDVLSMANVYARGSDIDQVLRIAPRVEIGQGNFKVMIEFSEILASYGTPNQKMEVKDTDVIADSRVQVHFKYSF